MGYVGSKPRSLGQILEKSCVHSRGCIFSLIIFKLGQNVCLDKLQSPSLVLVKPRKDMNNLSCRCDMTEKLLKAA